MNKEKILVTPRAMTSPSLHPSLKKIPEGYEILAPFAGSRPSESELIEVIPDCIGYIAGGEKVSARVLKYAKKLRVISRNGTGIDNIDVDVAKELGIEIRNAKGANAQGVAELTIALMFSMLRSIIPTNIALKQGKWERHIGAEVYSKTIGIVGTGEIGKRVAKMVSCLNMNVLAYDTYPNEALVDSIPSFEYVSLDKVFSSSDIITLHCSSENQVLVNKNSLANMKSGAYLINTARAGLVDQHAVLEALQNSQLSAYAVDAFETEPPTITELYLHPNVILSSHIGGYTMESIDRAATDSVYNLLDYFESN